MGKRHGGYLPSSSVGTNLEAMDLMAINDVPLNISTMAPEKYWYNSGVSSE